jgi:MYXO-CTERM domain-containing protein
MRSTFLFGAVAVAATAFSASADLVGNPTPWEGGELEVRYVGSSSSFAPGDTLFDAQAGPYASLPVGTGLRGWTAYETTAASGGDSFFLGQFIFVGGVDTEGASVGFDFYEWDSATGAPGAFVDSFSVALPSAGAFIWTITLDPGFAIPTAGYVEMNVADDAGGLGRWFLTSTAPATGSILASFGTPDYSSQAFRMVEGVPAPGAIALLGVAGLAGSRRRRN